MSESINLEPGKMVPGRAVSVWRERVGATFLLAAQARSPLLIDFLPRQGRAGPGATSASP